MSMLLGTSMRIGGFPFRTISETEIDVLISSPRQTDAQGDYFICCHELMAACRQAARAVRFNSYRLGSAQNEPHEGVCACSITTSKNLLTRRTSLCRASCWIRF